MVAKTVEKWKNLCGVEPDILPTLQNRSYSRFSLCRRQRKLPEAEQTKVDLGNGQMKRIKTIGDKWSMFQQVNF